MEGLRFNGEWSSDAARFGLADTIGEAVQDYYDLLFDNVHEFIGMNRDELREYEAEDAQLRKKLEDRSIDGAERKALEESREKNPEEIGRLREFLSGNRGSDVRNLREYSENGLLVAVDAFRFGTEEVWKFFPDVADKYAEHKKDEYQKLLESDPVRLHGDLVMKYATECIAETGQHFLELRHDRDHRQTQLREHEAAKPGLLKNLATFGNAGKAWRDRRTALTREMAEFEGKITEQKKIFGEGEFSENVRQRAKNSILSAHPEVVEACERHMARHWERKNEERLEKQEERQAGRDGAAGKTVDDGHSWNR